MKIIAKTFAGLEELLVKELEKLGAQDIEQGIRMVSFTGDKEMLYRANFCLRTAVKVLMPICEFKANDADEVYEKARNMAWADYMDVDTTFIIDAVVFSEEFRHSRFAAYKVKDAIADYFRDKTGKRPNVSISNPDLRINLHIAENMVTISLDSSGESLHQRGYRVGTVTAPLNEVLAAGMIMMTGWDGETDFYDPMCGSGTILVEAALIARNIYPGVFRKEFAFERWKDFDPELFDTIYNDDSQEREFLYKIYGSDINHQAVSIAQKNLKSAGVSDIVEVKQQDVRDLIQPEGPAIMVTNPPYGERITSEDILGLYNDLGKTLKHSFIGCDAWILSYHDECFAKIGFRPSTRYILYNGALECEFRKYQVFEGKMKERREEGLDIKTDEDRMRNLKFKGHKRVNDSSRQEDGTQEDEPRLNRHNFKWGDRKADYQPEGEDHYFKSRPFDRKPFDRERSGKKLFDRERSDRKPFDRERSERKPFDRDRSDKKPFRRDDKRSDRRGPRDFSRSDKTKGDDKRVRLRFDAEGKPVTE